MDQEKRDEMYHRVQEHTPNSRQLLGLVTLLALGGVLLTVGGITLAGTVITILLATPVLIFFSPILIPLATVLFLGVSGLVSAGAFGYVCLAGASWLYNYFKGRNPPGSDQVEHARHRLTDTAQQLKHRAAQYGSNAQNTLQAKTDAVAPSA